MQINDTLFIHLNYQKTTKDFFLTLKLEKQQSLQITLFDHKKDQVTKMFDSIKQFAIVVGFDYAYDVMDQLGKGSFATVSDFAPFTCRSIVSKISSTTSTTQPRSTTKISTTATSTRTNLWYCRLLPNIMRVDDPK